MKLLFLGYFSPWLLYLLYMAYLFQGSTHAQSFDDPKLYFQKFEFDWVNRGSFNISQCMKDLMTCFELVKADVICKWREDVFQGRYYDTICPAMRGVCHDYFLDYDFWNWGWSGYKSWERVCHDDKFNEWT